MLGQSIIAVLTVFCFVLFAFSVTALLILIFFATYRLAQTIKVVLTRTTNKQFERLLKKVLFYLKLIIAAWVSWVLSVAVGAAVNTLIGVVSTSCVTVPCAFMLLTKILQIDFDGSEMELVGEIEIGEVVGKG